MATHAVWSHSGCEWLQGSVGTMMADFPAWFTLWMRQALKYSSVVSLPLLAACGDHCAGKVLVSGDKTRSSWTLDCDEAEAFEGDV